MNQVSAKGPVTLEHRNYYLEFMSHSRWISDISLKKRAEWFEQLDISEKEELFFMFEMLLKGLACFGNPANHPGEGWQGKAAENHNFKLELGIIASTLRMVIETGENFLGLLSDESMAIDFFQEADKDDPARTDFMENEHIEGAPEKSLLLLLSSLSSFNILINGMLKNDEITIDEFSAVNIQIYREIIHSSYFNILSSYEFRFEYDQIKMSLVLQTIRSIEHSSVRKITTFVFLSLFRMLRYIKLILSWNESSGLGPLLVLLSLVRSDGLNLGKFLSGDAHNWISSGFSADFKTLSSYEIHDYFDELNLQYEELKSLKELLDSTGDQLNLELKKTFIQQIVPVSQMNGTGKVENIKQVIISLESFLQNSVVLLVREFNINADGDALFENFTSDATRSLRLQRDIWIFRQILKAFVSKAQGAQTVGDKWTGLNTFKFVNTFIDYFRSMGYQLLRYSDYARFDKFIALVDRLKDGDALEIQSFEHVLEECDAFYLYLEKMFEAVSNRKELSGMEFDKKDAARTLKLFIQ